MFVSSGRDVEVFKGLGLPVDISDEYRLPTRHGYLAVGHTRMATESAVTTDGSHPFSTHGDLCVVHNGSFSNYFTVRRDLEGQGERFLTENDTEVAARLIGREMAHGRDLRDALAVLQKEMDGFYTLVCTTRDQMAVVRDEFGCKPAMVAVSDRYVAVASEFRGWRCCRTSRPRRCSSRHRPRSTCGTGRDERRAVSDARPPRPSTATSSAPERSTRRCGGSSPALGPGS